LVDTEHQILPVYRQCEFLGLSKASYYYKPRAIDTLNLLLMRLIDEQYTWTPFYGVPRMAAWLKRQGYEVNPKRVRRLMRLMGLEAVYPKPWLSKPAKGHKKYPYLLKGLIIKCPDHVWSADITYVRLVQGFIYLVAIMDWFSR
jgi:putative transposase